MIEHKKHLNKKLKNKKFKEEFLYEKKMAELAVRIQKEREKKGMSQQELAQKAHVTQQQLSSIENGANYTIKTSYKIGKALAIKDLTLSFRSMSSQLSLNLKNIYAAFCC